jgi:hypothetical protein
MWIDQSDPLYLSELMVTSAFEEVGDAEGDLSEGAGYQASHVFGLVLEV